MMHPMIAGKMENSSQIISFTATGSVMVTMVLPVSGSVPEMNPERPNRRATNEPLMAVPNFCDIVPLEKITPVDEVPFFSVA